MTRTFTCTICRGAFETRWSEKEARAEQRRNFPGVPDEECGTVCQSCFDLLPISPNFKGAQQ